MPTKQDSVYLQRAFRDKYPTFLCGSTPCQGCRYSFNQNRTGCRSLTTLFMCRLKSRLPNWLCHNFTAGYPSLVVGESGGIKVYNAPQQTGMLLRHKMFLINSQVEHQHSVAKWSAISSFLLYSAASLHLLFQMWLLKMGIWSLLLPIFLFLLLAMETQCKVHVCRKLVRCLTAIFTNIQTLKFKSHLHNWCRQS